MGTFTSFSPPYCLERLLSPNGSRKHLPCLIDIHDPKPALKLRILGAVLCVELSAVFFDGSGYSSQHCVPEKTSLRQKENTENYQNKKSHW
jgi:hypothetical protein